MRNLADYKRVFEAMGLIGIVLFSLPSVMMFAHLPDRDGFSELYLLGPGHLMSDYPSQVSSGKEYLVYLGIENRVGLAQYYKVIVKFRNASEPLPNATEGIASSLPALYTYNVFLSDGQIWENALTFSFNNVTLGQNTSSVIDLNINGLWTEVNKNASWDEARSGYYYEMFVELWTYNTSSNDFSFNDRFVALWLNMTAP